MYKSLAGIAAAAALIALAAPAPSTAAERNAPGIQAVGDQEFSSQRRWRHSRVHVRRAWAPRYRHARWGARRYVGVRHAYPYRYHRRAYIGYRRPYVRRAVVVYRRPIYRRVVVVRPIVVVRPVPIFRPAFVVVRPRPFFRRAYFGYPRPFFRRAYAYGGPYYRRPFARPFVRAGFGRRW